MRSVVLGAAAALLVTGVAAADGGSSIAAAPALPFGAEQQASTATGAAVPADASPNQCPEHHSFWAVPAIRGDVIHVTWTAPTADMKMQIFPRGTSDAAYLQTAPIVSSTLNDTRSAIAVFKPTRSGTYPLDFYSVDCPGVSDDPGPYTFTATVQHAVRLALAAPRTLSRTGTVRVGLKRPDGTRLTGSGPKVRLQLTSPRGAFVTIGSATASGGTVKVDYTVPAALRDRRGRLRALATGPSFTSSVSVERVVDTR